MSQYLAEEIYGGFRLQVVLISKGLKVGQDILHSNCVGSRLVDLLDPMFHGRSFTRRDCRRSSRNERGRLAHR